MQCRKRFAWLSATWIAVSALSTSAAEDISKAQRDISGITRRLNDLDAWFSDATRRQRDLQKELRDTDQSIASTSSQIRRIEDELKRIAASLTELKTQQDALNEQRDAQAKLIASHLAAAYRLSGEDFLKLLLNQQSPDQFDRMIRYHRYFSSARTEALEAYQKTLAAIDANTAATHAREQELAAQERDLDGERTELRTKRDARERLLVALNTQIEGKSQEKSRLSEDRKRLAALVAELQRRAKERLEATTFARAKGKLPWPTEGKLAHRFGEFRAGGLLKWQGIFIDAAEGTPVTAVHSGQVAFSDWLRGFGLLTIIDHGSGYMSLYAHSDVLYKRVGDRVKAGETIATTGRSGGQSESGLYFEIRAKGAAIDPLAWLSRR